MSYIGGTPAPALSAAQIYQHAINAGFYGQAAITATAIGLAESAGIPNNFNPADPHGGSVGLFQINGANAGLIGGSSWQTTGTDPQASANAAYSLYSTRGGFTDWGAYTNGSYQNYLGQASAAAAAGGAADTSSGPTASFGLGNQNDALDHTGLSSTSPTDPSMYPATSATTSITNNDQTFNQPDPNKVETTNIASSGILGQTQIAKSTGQVAQSTLQGDTTIAQTQQQDTATAISGLGDLFARGSLVVIGLLLLGGAFVFYYMQHKDSTFGLKDTSTSSGQA